MPIEVLTESVENSGGAKDAKEIRSDGSEVPSACSGVAAAGQQFHFLSFLYTLS